MENLNYNYRDGYFNSDEIIEVPNGAMIYPSVNVIYNKVGRPVSFKDVEQVFTKGGSRAFVIDKNLVAFLGTDNSSNKAVGNLIQGVGKSLWFVGNSVNDGVRIFNTDTETLQNIGGTHQVESTTVVATITGAGTAVVTVTGAYISGSPIALNITVILSDTSSTIGEKIRTALKGNTAITNQYRVGGSGADITLTDKQYRANDGSLNVAINTGTAIGITNDSTSTNTTSGSIGTTADLSSIPQLCKWNGSGWDAPTQVGLPIQETPPELILTTDDTRGDDFAGLITGSFTARLAIKRGGVISIASPPSNLVIGDGNSVYMTIPPYPEDGSNLEDREWVIYLTPTGRGSQYSHLYFPITISEEELYGSVIPESHISGNAKLKVVSQDTTTQANRKVEIEYYNNDLLQLSPFDDYYSLESCKFIAQLGNVMCGIGTGEDGTGFDVSYPNNHESYSPDWRDWFAEEPVAMIQCPEQANLWVFTANTTYRCIWAGGTQSTAPVVLEQVDSKYGVIGEGAVCNVMGAIYGLSNGKTPFRIGRDGTMDVNFGLRVKNIFDGFDETTQIGYDEKTNSVVYTCGVESISFHRSREIWTAPLDLTTSGSSAVDSVFSLNGKLYMCSFDVSDYVTNEYNAGTGTVSWNSTSPFQLGSSGTRLKDIINARMILESESQPYTVSVYTYKDYVLSSPVFLFDYSGTSTSIKITVDKWLERLDYQAISVRVEGTKGGQTIHLLWLTVDDHSIEKR